MREEKPIQNIRSIKSPWATDPLNFQDEKGDVVPEEQVKDPYLRQVERTNAMKRNPKPSSSRQIAKEEIEKMRKILEPKENKKIDTELLGRMLRRLEGIDPSYRAPETKESEQ